MNTLKQATNANEACKTGDYIMPSTASNIPVARWGILKVSGNGGDAFQTINIIGSNDVYVRSKTSGGDWVDWRKIQLV